MANSLKIRYKIAWPSPVSGLRPVPHAHTGTRTGNGTSSGTSSSTVTCAPLPDRCPLVTVWQLYLPHLWECETGLKVSVPPAPATYAAELTSIGASPTIMATPMMNGQMTAFLRDRRRRSRLSIRSPAPVSEASWLNHFMARERSWLRACIVQQTYRPAPTSTNHLRQCGEPTAVRRAP